MMVLILVTIPFIGWLQKSGNVYEIIQFIGTVYTYIHNLKKEKNIPFIVTFWHPLSMFLVQ